MLQHLKVGPGYVDPLPSTSPLLRPFPSLPFTSLPFLFPPSPQKYALKSSWEFWRSAVSSPSGVWGGAAAEIEFDAFSL